MAASLHRGAVRELGRHDCQEGVLQPGQALHRRRGDPWGGGRHRVLARGHLRGGRLAGRVGHGPGPAELHPPARGTAEHVPPPGRRPDLQAPADQRTGPRPARGRHLRRLPAAVRLPLRTVHREHRHPRLASVHRRRRAQAGLRDRLSGLRPHHLRRHVDADRRSRGADRVRGRAAR